MEVTTDVKTYRSPRYKLVRFFNESRDRWRKKCLAAKTRIKRLENRVAGLLKSRRKWKEKAQAERARVVQLTKELEQEKTDFLWTAAR